MFDILHFVDWFLLIGILSLSDGNLRCPNVVNFHFRDAKILSNASDIYSTVCHWNSKTILKEPPKK